MSIIVWYLKEQVVLGMAESSGGITHSQTKIEIQEYSMKLDEAIMAASSYKLFLLSDQVK